MADFVRSDWLALQRSTDLYFELLLAVVTLRGRFANVFWGEEKRKRGSSEQKLGELQLSRTAEVLAGLGKRLNVDVGFGNWPTCLVS